MSEEPFENGRFSEYEIAQKQRYLTDKKENQTFLIYKEIQNGAVAKSYMTNGLLIDGETVTHFLMFDFATAPL